MLAVHLTTSRGVGGGRVRARGCGVALGRRGALTRGVELALVPQQRLLDRAELRLWLQKRWSMLVLVGSLC